MGSERSPGAKRKRRKKDKESDISQVSRSHLKNKSWLIQQVPLTIDKPENSSRLLCAKARLKPPKGTPGGQRQWRQTPWLSYLFPFASPIIEKWNVPRIPNSPRERWLGPCGPDVWCQRWMNLASFQPSEGFYFPFPGTYSFRWFLWLDDSSLFSSPSTTCYCCKYVVVLSCLWPRFSSEFAQVLVGHQ